MGAPFFFRVLVLTIIQNPMLRFSQLLLAFSNEKA